jgi:thymidylate synthase (FAD)
MTEAEIDEMDAHRRSVLLRWAGKTIPALDVYTSASGPFDPIGQGFVRLVDVMGDDARIAAAARLSYSAGKGKTRSSEEGLIRYLMRNRHSSPTEMAQITLHLKMPIFVARQLVRHRTASLNEMSGRYSILPDEFYIPPAEQVCAQATDNKQGRADPLGAGAVGTIRDYMHRSSGDAFRFYQDFLKMGLAKETARMMLPVSTYTEWWWTFDAHNLLHMLGLRLDKHAQWECRVYAEAIARIVADWLPMTWKAFVDYRLEAHTLSGPEVRALRQALAASTGAIRDGAEVTALASENGVNAREIGGLLTLLELES